MFGSHAPAPFVVTQLWDWALPLGSWNPFLTPPVKFGEGARVLTGNPCGYSNSPLTFINL